MKKYSKVLFVLISILLINLGVGCKNFIAKSGFAGDDQAKEHTSYAHDDKMNSLASLGCYKISEEEIESDVINAVLSFYGNDNDSRETNAENYTLTKIQSSEYVVPMNAKSRSSAAENYESIDFSVYQFDSTNEENEKYIITSNDLRIGEIIAICDGSFEDDITDNPFMQMIAQGLENYIDNTLKEYETMDRNESNSRESANAYIFQDPNYKVTSAVAHSGFFYNHIITKWNQDSPYNDCIAAVESQPYAAGCVAVALAQICAFHEYPERCSNSVFNIIKSKWVKAKDWNGVYDYYKMKHVGHYEYAPYAEYLTRGDIQNKIETQYGIDIENLSDVGRMNIGALIYEIGKGVKMEYGIDESGANDEDAMNWLRSVGFHCSDVCDYSFNKIQNSIDKGCPVYVGGYRTRTEEPVQMQFLWWKWKSKNRTNYVYKNGHAWIVDDYANITCTVEHKVQNKMEKFSFTDNFVHCNFGWSGECNGYYLNGVFDLNNGANIYTQDICDECYSELENASRKIVDDESSQKPKYYQYKLTMIYDIY